MGGRLELPTEYAYGQQQGQGAGASAGATTAGPAALRRRRVPAAEPAVPAERAATAAPATTAVRPRKPAAVRPDRRGPAAVRAAGEPAAVRAAGPDPVPGTADLPSVPGAGPPGRLCHGDRQLALRRPRPDVLVHGPAGLRHVRAVRPVCLVHGGGAGGGSPSPWSPSRSRRRSRGTRCRRCRSRRGPWTRGRSKLFGAGCCCASCSLQAGLSLRLGGTAFKDEALYIASGRYELANLLHGAELPVDFAAYFSGHPQAVPVIAAVVDSEFGLDRRPAQSAVHAPRHRAALLRLHPAAVQPACRRSAPPRCSSVDQQSTMVLGKLAT